MGDMADWTTDNGLMPDDDSGWDWYTEPPPYEEPDWAPPYDHPAADPVDGSGDEPPRADAEVPVDCATQTRPWPGLVCAVCGRPFGAVGATMTTQPHVCQREAVRHD